MTGVDFLLAWMQTPNPMLGGVTPLWMLEHDRGDKLARFIREAIADSAPAVHTSIEDVERLHPRVAKLIRRGEPFFVVKASEPYAPEVVDLIRAHEGIKWTDEDEQWAREALRAAATAPVLRNGDTLEFTSTNTEAGLSISDVKVTRAESTATVDCDHCHKTFAGPIFCCERIDCPHAANRRTGSTVSEGR